MGIFFSDDLNANFIIRARAIFEEVLVEANGKFPFLRLSPTKQLNQGFEVLRINKRNKV
jgi:hypothetical protein